MRIRRGSVLWLSLHDTEFRQSVNPEAGRENSADVGRMRVRRRCVRRMRFFSHFAFVGCKGCRRNSCLYGNDAGVFGLSEFVELRYERSVSVRFLMKKRLFL